MTHDHHKHKHESDHLHAGHENHGSMVQDFKKRFWISIAHHQTISSFRRSDRF